MLRSARILFVAAIPFLASAKEETFTDTATIRSLPRIDASNAYPVELTAQIINNYVSSPFGNLIIEQNGTGIFVNMRSDKYIVRDASGKIIPNNDNNDLRVGTEISIKGTTGPGQYAPVIDASEIRVLGNKPLPQPKPFVLSQIVTGSMDCQRIELRGVIHGAELTGEQDSILRMELAVPSGRLVVEINPRGSWTPEQVLGATVRVNAVSLSFFNVRGELLGIHFVVSDPDALIIEKPGPKEPFSVPTVPLTALQPFSPDGPNLERIQVTGRVTLSRPGEFLYLEDSGRAVRVFTRDKTRYQSGDVINASGFIEIHQNYGELRGATVRKTGETKAAPPTLVTTRELIDSSTIVWGRPPPVDFNGRLIKLRGTLSNIEEIPTGGRRLSINTVGEPVTASLDSDGGAENLDSLIIGSAIEITGICELQFPSAQLLTDFPNPTGFSMLMRSHGDVRILRSASWWTPTRLWMLVGIATAVIVFSLIWNLILRRLVKKRSAQLAEETRARDRAEIEFEATSRERTRLAADLHDTLEQALTGLSFQLDTSSMLANKAPETSSRHLDLGRQLLTRSREDLRRSIWNLRSRELEGHSLADAIRATALQATEGRSVAISVREEGTPRPIADFISGNLLLLAQEAITNSIKHAAPTRIEVLIGYLDSELSLDIRDNGCGFDPANSPGTHEGHFGLQGMKERANRLDGTLAIDSSLRNGASVKIRVPLGQ